jgi:hypothetical protein
MYIQKLCIWALSIFLTVFLHTDTSGKPQTKKENGIRVTLFTPDQAVLGESTEVTVSIDPKVTIQSVEITPPEGVSVSTIKALERTSGDKEMKIKRWSLEFLVDKQAQPGKRVVVLLTSHGRSEAKTLDIPPHVPQVSDFKLISVESRPVKVQFMVSVFDEAGDFDPNNSVSYSMQCGGSLLIGVLHAEKVDKKDAKNSVLHITISDSSTNANSSICDFVFTVKDANGYVGRLKSTLEFK